MLREVSREKLQWCKRRPQLCLGALCIFLSATGLVECTLPTSSLPNPHVQAAPIPIKKQQASPALPSRADITPQPIRPVVDCGRVACLALTFDDGPSRSVTPAVLSALQQAQVPATFFVVGSRVAVASNVLQQAYQQGNEIGNHSWSHHDLTKLTPEQITAEIDQTQTAVTAAGAPAPTLFRPPYGATNEAIRNAVHLPSIMWNNDSQDWESRNPARIIAAVEAQARPGAIVELHDIYPSTAAALPQLLSDLKQHYQLVTVSDLLDLQPGQTGQFFARQTQ